MSPNPQPLKSGGDRPLYRQISDTLLAGIRDGLFPVGTLLPGELDLIGRYGTSRHTVREALRVLEDMGIVKRERGRGTLVISTEARPAFVQSVKDPRELFSYPKNSKFRVLSEGKFGDNEAWPSKMGSDISVQWARISGLRTLS
ncbi:MAG: GntR family transcriptional regulator, partial [Luminiphilus sp.]